MIGHTSSIVLSVTLIKAGRSGHVFHPHQGWTRPGHVFHPQQGWAGQVMYFTLIKAGTG